MHIYLLSSLLILDLELGKKIDREIENGVVGNNWTQEGESRRSIDKII
jgi:hypothetical protein